MSVFGYIVTDCHISYSPFLSISLYLSFSVSVCIIGNLHVCEQARSARLVCKRSRKLMYDYYNSCAYMYVSCLLGSEFPFQSPDMLWLILCAYMSHDRVFVCFCFLSLNICSSVRLNVSLIVGRCIFPSLDPCFFSLSVSFSLNTSISVRLYCHWLHVNRYVSWSSYFSFCLSVSVSGILSVILRVSWFVFLSLFLNVCSNVSLFYHSL